jgi:predicted phage terminase large subunit-like protein
MSQEPRKPSNGTNSLSSEDKEILWNLFRETILQNKYILHKPAILPDGRSPQTQFIINPAREKLYGGAAGGGKTDALLMCALQYLNIPGYHAIIFRRTLQDHKKPEGLIHRTLEWLGDTNAKWNGQDYVWTTPYDSTLTLGYMDNDKDVYHHQSAAYQFIGWDELTQFEEWQYRYMKSRLRRLKTSFVPLRICSATNPEPNWVKQYFLIEGAQNGRAFIPAKASDNPFLDWETYLRNLSELDPVTRARLRDGDWNITVQGNVFKRGKFTVVQAVPASMRLVRMWDKAATEPTAGKDPAYTVGLKLGVSEGKYYILGINRFRGAPALVESTIKQTAVLDGAHVIIGIEQEPGSAGVDDLDYYQRKVLQGFNVRAVKVTGNKLERAGPVSSAVDAGNVYIFEAAWNSDFLDEVSVFPEGKFKDQVDALSGAFTLLTQGSDAIRPAWVLR